MIVRSAAASRHAIVTSRSILMLIVLLDAYNVHFNTNHANCIFKAEALMAASTSSTSDSSSGGTMPSLHHVLVTGASGRTGQLVFSALLDDPRFEPKALVRSERSAKQLMKQVPKTRLDQIVISDVTYLSENVAGKTSIDSPSGLEGLDSMVVCTSAVPRISRRSLFMALIMAPINLVMGKKIVDFRKLRFVWKYGNCPEEVDYHGQIAQFELAKKLKMKEVVVVSSMGGTDPSNFLNQVGKKTDGSGDGDILLWKRKAEKYLVDSGLDYVIIHPGGLIDTQAGQEDFVLDVNDNLLNNKKRSISRADVAILCVAALALDPNEIKCINCYGKNHNIEANDRISMAPSFLNKPPDKTPPRKQISLDCVTQAPEAGKPVRSAEQALKNFLKQSKTYDYAL